MPRRRTVCGFGRLPAPVAAALTCTALALVATVLYGIQWAGESIQLSDEEAVPCTVRSSTVHDGLCFVTTCVRGECVGSARQCFKLSYRVTLRTPNDLAMLATTEQVGAYGTVAEANAAAAQLVGSSTACYFWPGSTRVSLEATPMESSWIPIAVFGVAYCFCSVCACACKIRHLDDIDGHGAEDSSSDEDDDARV